jgi:hypothetical protein
MKSISSIHLLLLTSAFFAPPPVVSAIHIGVAHTHVVAFTSCKRDIPFGKTSRPLHYRQRDSLRKRGVHRLRVRLLRTSIDLARPPRQKLAPGEKPFSYVFTHVVSFPFEITSPVLGDRAPPTV